MKIGEASEQQLALALKQLQSLLQAAKSDDNYEIVKTKNHIGIRENSNKRPTEEQKKLVMQLLKIHPSFNKLAAATMGAQSTPAILIAELDENYLGQPAITPIKKMSFNQQQILKVSLLKILKALEVDKHYWVHSDGQRLMVCESSKAPPAEPIKTLVLAMLKMHPLFHKLARASFTLGNVEYPAFLIREIDQAPMAGKKPEKMDSNIWTHMPFEIKRRWAQFNPDLQNYLVQYVQTLLSQVQPAQSGKDAESIDLSIFPFSVRLPFYPSQTAAAPSGGAASAASAGMNNELTYDLLKLLVIEDRDPNNSELRRHPLSKTSYFYLLHIYPPAAPVANHAHDSGASKNTPKLDKPWEDLGLGLDDDFSPRTARRIAEGGLTPPYSPLGMDSPDWDRDSENSDDVRDALGMGLDEEDDLSRMLRTDDLDDDTSRRRYSPDFDDMRRSDAVAYERMLARLNGDHKDVSDSAAAPAKPVPVAAAGTSASVAPAKPVPVAAAGTSASAAPTKPIPVATVGTLASAAPAKPVLVAAVGTLASAAQVVPAAASQAKLGLFGSIWKVAGSVANTAANIFSSTNGING